MSNFDIKKVIEELQNKKLFTSEAQMQLEMAMIIKGSPGVKNVIPEYVPKFDSKMHIDLLVITNDNKWIPIELKYKKKELKFIDEDTKCLYSLTNQGARDYGCYDYLKDIQRIESIRKENKTDFQEGYTIFITNDKGYQKAKDDKVNYIAFALLDKTTKKGELSWREGSCELTKSKSTPIKLDDEYQINWEKFSAIDFDEKEKRFPNAREFFVLINKIDKIND